MDDPGRAGGRDVGPQAVGDFLDEGDLPALRLLPLAPPSPQRPLDVAVAPAEVAEADIVGVHSVELGQDVDQ